MCSLSIECVVPRIRRQPKEQVRLLTLLLTNHFTTTNHFATNHFTTTYQGFEGSRTRKADSSSAQSRRISNTLATHWQHIGEGRQAIGTGDQCRLHQILKNNASSSCSHASSSCSSNLMTPAYLRTSSPRVPSASSFTTYRATPCVKIALKCVNKPSGTSV